MGTVGPDRRVGVVGIVITDRGRVAGRVQEVLSQHGDMIVGRMGIPYRERDLAVIALIVDGTTDQVGALTGKLGQLPGVLVRSSLAPPLAPCLSQPSHPSSGPPAVSPEGR
ncbi:MAG: TM1266 family iron-only hydrogenase system putative regulator [Bacillota bacterium]